MTLSRHAILPCLTSLFLSLAIFLLCPPAECRTRRQSADGHVNSPQARDARAKPPVRPPDLEAFAAEAEAAPPEVASDALIRLASSTRVSDTTWKKELIERAFALAGTSPLPVRKK